MVMESPGKVLEIFVSEGAETCVCHRHVVTISVFDLRPVSGS